MAIPTHKLFNTSHQVPSQSSSMEAPRRTSNTTRVSVISSGQQQPIHATGLNREQRGNSRPRMHTQMSVSFGEHRPQKSVDTSGSSTRSVPRRISSLFSAPTNPENPDSRPSSPVPGQKELLQTYLERRVAQVTEETLETLGAFSDIDEDGVSIPQWGDDMLSVEVPELGDGDSLLTSNNSRPGTVRIKTTPRYYEPNDREQSPQSSYDDEDADDGPWDPGHTSRPSLRSARSVGLRSARSQGGSSALSRQMSSIPVDQIHSVFDSQQREQMQDLYMDTFMKQLQELKKNAADEANVQFKKPLEQLQTRWDDASKQLEAKQKETDGLKQEIERLREDKDLMERRILDSVRLESQSREKVVKERQEHIQTKQEMESTKKQLESLRMQFGIQERKMRHSIHFGEVQKSIEASRPASTRTSRLGQAPFTFGTRGVPPPKANGRPIAIDLPSVSEVTTALSPQAQRIQESIQRTRKSAPEQQLEEGIRRLRAKLQLARANAEHMVESAPVTVTDRDSDDRNVQFGGGSPPSDRNDGGQPSEDKPLLWSGARKSPSHQQSYSMAHRRLKSRSMFGLRALSDNIMTSSSDGSTPSSANRTGRTPTLQWRQFLAQQQAIQRAERDRRDAKLRKKPISDTPRSTTATVGTRTPASKGSTPLLIAGRSVQSFGDAIPTMAELDLKAQLTRTENDKMDLEQRVATLERQLSERDGRAVEDDEKKVDEKIAPMPNPNIVLPPPSRGSLRLLPPIRERRFSKAAVDFPAKPRAQPKRNMRRLDWKPARTLHDTIWMQINDGDVFLDTKEIEVNFGEKRRRRRKTSEVPEYKSLEDENLTHWIPEKRRHFVHESLRRFRLSADEIRHALIVMDERMTPDTLMKLLDVIPTLDEQNQARIYSHTPKETLGFAEYFFAKLSDVAYLRDRIQLWLFKLQFQEIIGQYRSEIGMLHDTLTSIQESTSLPEFLKVLLAVGNYVNSNSPRGGAYGFDLASVAIFEKFKSNGGKFTFLSYIVQYCEKHYPSALDWVDQLRSTHDASKATTHIIAQKVMDVSGELTKLGSSLRKFRQHPIELGDQFVTVMKSFHREALMECKTALDEWHGVRDLGSHIAKLFDLTAESVEDVCSVFDNLVSAIRRARDHAVKAERERLIEVQARAKIRQAQQAVELRLSVRPQPVHLHAKNIITHESTRKQREEVKRELSRLVYERSKLLEFQQTQNDGEMTVQRLKYLRDLIKSHETPTNISNPFDMAQKQRRRRRSLTADEIGIGISLPLQIREDDEVR